MKTLPLLAAACASVLAGCNSATVSPHDAATLDLSKTGLVLVTWEPGDSIFERRNAATTEVFLKPLSGGGSEREALAIKSTQPVSLVELSPGRYQLSDFILNAGGITVRGPLDQKKERSLFEFEVRPGEVTYLGNFHPVLTTPRQDAFFPSHGALYLQDWSAQTLAVFRRQYPTLSNARIRDAAPPILAWDLLPPADEHALLASTVGERINSALENVPHETVKAFTPFGP